MEGTKHEKVVLVILAYLIGFTSALIAYGIKPIPDYFPPETELELNNVLENTDFVDKQDIQSSTTVATNQSTDEFVTYHDGRLGVHSDNGDFLLSINKDLVDKELLVEFKDYGVHYSKFAPFHIVSADKQFIYFCEQHGDEDNCSNFIFDVKSSVIQFVNNEKQKIVTSRSVAEKAYWQEDGTLVVGDFTSVSPDTPWKVVRR